MRKNSIKNTRVNTEVMHELSNILPRGDQRFPRVAEFYLCCSGGGAPDLKTCKAYISVLGDEKAQADTIRDFRVPRDIFAENSHIR